MADSITTRHYMSHDGSMHQLSSNNLITPLNLTSISQRTEDLKIDSIGSNLICKIQPVEKGIQDKSEFFQQINFKKKRKD